MSPGESIYISPLSISMNPSLVDVPNITSYSTVLTGYLGKDAVLTEKMFGQWAGLSRSLFSVGGSDIDIEYVKQTTFVSYWCFAMMVLSVFFFGLSYMFKRIDECFSLPLSDLICLSRGTSGSQVSLTKIDSKPVFVVENMRMHFFKSNRDLSMVAVNQSRSRQTTG